MGRDDVVGVVVLDVRDERIGVPELVQRIGHGALTSLIATRVADQEDLLKAMHLERVHDVDEDVAKGVLAHRDRPGAHHVARLRVDAALGHELHRRSAEGITQLAGDGFAVRVQHVVVLARNEPRTVRLHAARGDDCGGLARLERVADIHPRHLLHPDRVRRRKGVRRILAVVRVGSAGAATHIARIGGATPTLASAATAAGGRRILRERGSRNENQ